MLGATADPEVQQLVFLGLWGLPGVIAQPHPQTSPRPCHLQRSTQCFIFIWAEKKCWLSLSLTFLCCFTEDLTRVQAKTYYKNHYTDVQRVDALT